MCGIFGFVSTNGKGPSIKALNRIALATETRGAHAFGLAWIDRDGRACVWKQPGAASMYVKLGLLEVLKDARLVIGHCRYATHGSYEDNRNNHPHAAGSGWLVHNGVVANHERLIDAHGLAPTSECDSEVLALLMSEGRGNIVARAAWTANQAVGDLAVLGLWAKPARLLVVRRGRPLHFSRTDNGYYFASLPQGMPGMPKPVDDRTARVLRLDDKGLRGEGPVQCLEDERRAVLLPF